MTYIKLEDVQKILDTDENKYIYWETAIIEIEKQINSLPSIDPQEIIQEMIQHFDKEDKDIDSLDDYFMWVSCWKTIWLKRLLSVFNS